MYNAVVLNAYDQPQLRSHREYRDCVASNIPVNKLDIMTVKSNITNAWFGEDFISNKYQQTAPSTLPCSLEARRQIQNRSYRQSSDSELYALQNKVYKPSTILTVKQEDDWHSASSTLGPEQNDRWYNAQPVIPTIDEPCNTNVNVDQPATVRKLQRVNVQSSPFYYGCMCGHDFIYRPHDAERNDTKLEVSVVSPIVNVRLR